MLIGSLALAAGAEASTISTYSFTQTGYHGGSTSNGLTGILTGTFSGTVESSGYLYQGDLTDFSYTFTIYNIDHSVFAVPLTGALQDLALFSYNTTGGATTFQFQAQNAVNMCVGIPAALGFCGVPQAGYGPGDKGAFEYGTGGSGTQAFLWSTTPPDITSVATTPIPATLPLFASSISALGLLRWRKRRTRPLPTA